MSDTLRLLIADDEEPARRLIRRYLKKRRDIEVAAECTDGDELQGAMERSSFDLLLLDIRMPGKNVLDVLEERRRAGDLPLVVFTTAYDHYAVRAFEVSAVDYLLKPFSEERFQEAVDRASARRGTGAATENLTRLLRDLGPRPSRLLVPMRGKMVSIAIADVIWIKAEGDYTRIHASGRSYLVTRTLNELEERLDPMQFIRIHRSAIIQTDKIREVSDEGSARYRVTLEDGTTVIVSRSRAPQLKRWII